MKTPSLRLRHGKTYWRVMLLPEYVHVLQLRVEGKRIKLGEDCYFEKLDLMASDIVGVTPNVFLCTSHRKAAKLKDELLSKRGHADAHDFTNKNRIP